MKIGITRKINLQRYGGNQYESADFWIEQEFEKEFKDFEKNRIEMEANLNWWIEEYIKRLPQQMALFDKAKDEQPPFITQSELTKSIISPEQQARHDELKKRI